MSVFFRTRVLRVGAWSLVVLCLGTFVAAAQNPPLAEVARREEERRKAVDPTKPAPRVITNKDLPKVAGPTASPAPVAPAVAAVAGDPAKVAADPDSAGKDEAWWRARITAARDALVRDQVLLDALGARLDGLAAVSTVLGDPNQRARIGEDQLKAVAEMDRIRAEVADLTTKIADIEEEARKASVPPGWLR
jgi:hypothetical protein